MITPKVSVVIPTHNRPHLLQRAIASVLAQTFQDFEIIVVDDGEEKSADHIVRACNDPRIIYSSDKKEQGGSAARNTGIRRARGEFIGFLDDDDVWISSKLEKQVDAFTRVGHEVGVVFCGVEVVDKDGRMLYKRLPNTQGIVEPFRELLQRCFIWTGSIMIRREWRDRGFLFDDKLPKNQEWDLLLRLSKVTKFFAIDEALLILYVQGPNEHLGGLGNIVNIARGLDMFIEKHLDEYKKYEKRSLALRYFQLGLLYRDSSQIRKAREALWKSLKVRPLQIVCVGHFIDAALSGIPYRFLKSIKRMIANLLPQISAKKTEENLRQAYHRYKNTFFIGTIFHGFKFLYRRSMVQEMITRRRGWHEAHRIIRELYGATKAIEDYFAIAKKKRFIKMAFSFGHAGDFDTIMLYVLTRVAKPSVVIETGVASGRSSTAILEALKDNRKGRLISIDLVQVYDGDQPRTFISEGGRSEYHAFIPREKKEPGWLIPSDLKDRWMLIVGDSKKELPKVVQEVGAVDMFYHDSEHSYDAMLFEYKTVWPALSHGGLLLSDDVKWNNAFKDFVGMVRPRYSTQYASFGAAMKQ